MRHCEFPWADRVSLLIYLSVKQSFMAIFQMWKNKLKLYFLLRDKTKTYQSRLATMQWNNVDFDWFLYGDYESEAETRWVSALHTEDCQRPSATTSTPLYDGTTSYWNNRPSLQLLRLQHDNLSPHKSIKHTHGTLKKLHYFNNPPQRIIFSTWRNMKNHRKTTAT